MVNEHGFGRFRLDVPYKFLYRNVQNRPTWEYSRPEYSEVGLYYPSPTGQGEALQQLLAPQSATPEPHRGAGSAPHRLSRTVIQQNRPQNFCNYTPARDRNERTQPEPPTSVGSAIEVRQHQHALSRATVLSSSPLWQCEVRKHSLVIQRVGRVRTHRDDWVRLYAGNQVAVVGAESRRRVPHPPPKYRHRSPHHTPGRGQPRRRGTKTGSHRIRGPLHRHTRIIASLRRHNLQGLPLPR